MSGDPTRRWHACPVVAPLSSRSAPVRAARALTQAKHRRTTGLFLAEGPQAVREALAAGVATEVLVGRSATARRGHELGAAGRAGVRVHVVDDDTLAALVSAQAPQGIVAVCRWQQPGWQDVVAATCGPGRGPLVLAHEMSDPGNAGAVIRVADASGAAGVALSRGSVDPTNAKCVRASAGSLFHLPVVEVGRTVDAVAGLRQAGVRVLAADVTTDSVDLFAAERGGLLAGSTCWVLGNEAHGLPGEVLAAVDAVVRIPILGRAESLNVATAAAVCLYATARVRTLGDGPGSAAGARH